MIVQSRGATALLMTQPDHAALSARIMERWIGGAFAAHPRRSSVLLAIREHDNGWAEVDACPIRDGSTGRILDFMTAPAAVRRAIWPRGVARLEAEPWAAALVAQHALHIYRRYRGNAEWSGFFQEMEAARDAHLRAARGGGLDVLLADYFFVRTGDLLSLTFCNGWRDPQEETGYLMRMDEGTLRVSPDPFGGEVIPVAVQAREVPNVPYATDSDAARAFATAPVRTLTGTACG